MDTLTHAISGAVLGRATAGLDRAALPVRRRALVGFVAAAFPDIDFALRLVVDPITFLNLHRGVTHSLLLLPFWAALLAWLFARFFPDSRARAYFPLAAMALAIHIAGDVITTYGTMIFAPFSAYKASIPTTFIIDPWFTGILLAGLIGSLLWRNSRRPALLSLLVLVGYIGFQGVQLQRATQLGWLHVQQQGLENAQVTALPQPLSPFNWQIVVETEQVYRMAAVNLRRGEAPEPAQGRLAELMASYRPADDLRWHTLHAFGEEPEHRALARTAWHSEAMTGFREFARFPHLFSLHRHEDGRACAWFLDLRFTLGEAQTRLRAPFQFGACLDSKEGHWRLYRYGDPPQLLQSSAGSGSPLLMAVLGQADGLR
jgi:inner membrane protein